MNEKIKKLSSEQIKFLKKKFQSLKFNNDFNLVYESQVPNTGIVLIDGEINLIRKKKSLSLNKPGIMLGVYELLNNLPTAHGCMVLGNTELIMIQKSDLMEALSDKDSELYHIIKEDIS